MGQDWDAVVIGAGFGGLVAAGYLAASGRRVLVLEQHDVAGGNGHVFRRRRTYEFDVGTHYLGDCGPDGVLPAILAGLGVGDRVRFHPMDPDGYDRIITPSVTLDVPTGWDRYRDRLVAALPGDAAGIGTFLRICATLAATDRTRLLDPPESGAPADAEVFRWSHRTLACLFDHCGLSTRARTVLAAQLGNYGTRPEETLVVTHAGMIGGYLAGAYYPAGGGQTVVAALVEALEAQGGTLRTRATVTRILVEDGRVAGVALADGSELRAPLVVSNADYRRTVLELCGGTEHLPGAVVRRTAKARMRLPMAAVYVALDTELEQPNANIWWWAEDDLDAAFGDFAADGLDRPPFAFLSFASIKDPEPGSACPPGHTNFQIMTACPSGPEAWGLPADAGVPAAPGPGYRRNPAYQAAKERLTTRLLEMAERAIGEFRPRIVHLETATPLTQQRYTHSTGGTPYGLAHWGKTGLRPDVGTDLPGLWLAGQNTRYGGGIVGAAVSGMVAASAVLGRELLPEVHRGAVPGNPALPAPPELDRDPLRISRGRARRDARGFPGLARPSGVVR